MGNGLYIVTIWMNFSQVKTVSDTYLLLEIIKTIETTLSESFIYFNINDM